MTYEVLLPFGKQELVDMLRTLSYDEQDEIWEELGSMLAEQDRKELFALIGFDPEEEK